MKPIMTTTTKPTMKPNVMFKRNVIMTMTVLALASLSQAAYADDAPEKEYTLLDSVMQGKPMTSFRLRYENVGQDGNQAGAGASITTPLKDANAITLRSLIGWQTAPFHNFSFAAQIIDVSKLEDNFNDSTPLTGPFNPAANQSDKLAYAKVVDPDYTGVNQLYMDWTGIKNTKLRLGRQQVNLDNTRFIGDIGFRQVMQVFDGVSVLNKSIPDTEVYLSHFESVRQINTKLRTDGALEIANIKYRISPSESIVGYGYFSSFNDLGFGNAWFGSGTTNANKDQGNKVLGLRLDGVHKIDDDWKAIYTAEYAKQTAYSGGDSSIDAHYYKIGGGASYGNLSLRIDQELLGSNNGIYAFQTPFGTNHLFQGWVDKFLATPKEGIRDSFITATYKYADVTFFADYHVLNSDQDFNKVGGGKGNKYGTEWNVAAAYNYNKNIMTKIEYGKYSESDQYQATPASARIRDTDKLWLTAMYTF